jgi:hypothetical protein
MTEVPPWLAVLPVAPELPLEPPFSVLETPALDEDCPSPEPHDATRAAKHRLVIGVRTVFMDVASLLVGSRKAQ